MDGIHVKAPASVLLQNWLLIHWADSFKVGENGFARRSVSIAPQLEFKKRQPAALIDSCAYFIKLPSFLSKLCIRGKNLMTPRGESPFLKPWWRAFRRCLMPIRNISILESTGPFGLQALKIVRENPKRFRVVGLSAGTNLSLLAAQIAQFRPEIVAISDADQLDDLEDAISAAELTPMLRAGPAGVLDVARYASAHTIIVDSAASNDRQSVRAAIMAGKDIILAAQDRSTKGVDGFFPLAKRHRVTLLAAGQSQSSILKALRAGTGGSGQGHAPAGAAIAEPAVQAAFARLDDQTTRAIRDGYRYLSLCTLGDHGLQSSIALD